MSRTARGGAGTLVLTALVMGVLVAAVPATAQLQPVVVTGSATCESTTGLLRLTFVLANQVGEPITVTSAVVADVAGAGALTVDPNPIPAGGAATGTAFVPGSTTGAVVLDVSYAWSAGTGVTSGSVTAPGGCVPRGTVSTSTMPAESTTTAAPPAVAVGPSFTG